MGPQCLLIFQQVGEGEGGCGKAISHVIPYEQGEPSCCRFLWRTIPVSTSVAGWLPDQVRMLHGIAALRSSRVCNAFKETFDTLHLLCREDDSQFVKPCLETVQPFDGGSMLG